MYTWIKTLGENGETECAYPSEIKEPRARDCLGYIYRDGSLWMAVVLVDGDEVAGPAKSRTAAKETVENGIRYWRTRLTRTS